MCVTQACRVLLLCNKVDSQLPLLIHHPCLQHQCLKGQLPVVIPHPWFHQMVILTTPAFPSIKSCSKTQDLRQGFLKSNILFWRADNVKPSIITLNLNDVHNVHGYIFNNPIYIIRSCLQFTWKKHFPTLDFDQWPRSAKDVNISTT